MYEELAIIEAHDLDRGTLHENRLLTEADQFNRLRGPEGIIPDEAREAVFINRVTSVKEGGIYFAVSETYQPFQQNEFMWGDQTSADVAESGYQYHWYPSILDRVEVEKDEARYVRDELDNGQTLVFVSPKVPEYDAPAEIAKDEHLYDDDMIRTHRLDIDEEGRVRGKFMDSILVRDIPLSAWVSMLRDPNNIFGRAIEIENDRSALEVMKAFSQMIVPSEHLKTGAVGVLEAVLPYLDGESKLSVEQQLEMMRTDQGKIDRLSKNIALRWTQFDESLADGLYTGSANRTVVNFIRELAFEWDEEMVAILEEREDGQGGYRLDRRLAAKLAASKQKLLLSSAAVAAGNDRVIEQIPEDVANKIFENELRVQTMIDSGVTIAEVARTEALNNQLIAKQPIKVGGGCAGEVDDSFRQKNKNKKSQSANETTKDKNPLDDSEESSDDLGGSEDKRKKWKTSLGRCRVYSCPSREQKEPVLLGPCNVCMGRCQPIYDGGNDPTSLIFITAGVKAKQKDKSVKSLLSF
jgi:hypothetical protein